MVMSPCHSDNMSQGSQVSLGLLYNCQGSHVGNGTRQTDRQTIEPKNHPVYLVSEAFGGVLSDIFFCCPLQIFAKLRLTFIRAGLQLNTAFSTNF